MCCRLCTTSNQSDKQMASLNYEQWHEWSTQMQNEHSKLTNTECCVCYSYQVLNKSVCGECKNYVCGECSKKLQYNECPICRTSGIVEGRTVEPREEINIIHEEERQPSTISENIVEIASFIYNDYMEFERNYRTNHTINTTYPHYINNYTTPNHVPPIIITPTSDAAFASLAQMRNILNSNN